MNTRLIFVVFNFTRVVAPLAFGSCRDATRELKTTNIKLVFIFKNIFQVNTFQNHQLVPLCIRAETLKYFKPCFFRFIWHCLRQDFWSLRKRHSRYSCMKTIKLVSNIRLNIHSCRRSTRLRLVSRRHSWMFKRIFETRLIFFIHSYRSWLFFAALKNIPRYMFPPLYLPFSSLKIHKTPSF